MANVVMKCKRKEMVPSLGGALSRFMHLGKAGGGRDLSKPAILYFHTSVFQGQNLRPNKDLLSTVGLKKGRKAKVLRCLSV